MKRGAVAAYAVLGVLLAGATGSSSAAHPDTGRRDLDLVASAQPSAALPAVVDDAFAAVSSRNRDVKADASATSSATCDGCSGDSAALQVVYVARAGQAQLDNAAIAWAKECQSCSATALSVQVVVLRGLPAAIPNNRAMAVNAACEGCRSSSLAFQLVVMDEHARRLSEASIDELRVWMAEQATLLRTPPAVNDGAPTPRSHRGDGEEAALADLESLVVADLGAEVLSAEVDSTPEVAAAPRHQSGR